MDIKMIDSCIAAIANELFTECKKIPSHVTAAECKNKRKLRDQLYHLAEAAKVVGCSGECTLWLGKRIQSWLNTNNTLDELSKPFSVADFALEKKEEYLISSDVEPVNITGVTFFRRRYYHNHTAAGSIVYNVESDYHSEAIAEALNEIPFRESRELEARIEAEKAITFDELYSEFSSQLREKQFGKVDWSAIDYAVSILLDDAGNMHERFLDRKSPLKEALTKYVAYKIKTLVLGHDSI